MYRPEWELPLPDALPVKLDDLCNNPSLMEDVWITRTAPEVPRWLEEVKVQVGIRAMLKLDHCLEERRRLGIEVDNLCRWFGRELSGPYHFYHKTQATACTAICSLPRFFMKWDNKANFMKCISFLPRHYFISISFLFHSCFISISFLPYYLFHYLPRCISFWPSYLFHWLPDLSHSFFISISFLP